ncbi:MAG: hypothetical protein R3C39_09120 [Dehalococcoidia bacterium]
MRARLARLRYLRSFMSVRDVAQHLVARAVSPIYYSERLFVTLNYLTELVDDRESGPGAIDSEVVFTVEDLHKLRPRMHPDIDFEYLVSFLSEDLEGGRVTLKTIEGENGEKTFIGWSTNRARVFRMPEYRFGGRLAEHVEASYDLEIVPEYRGRGLSYRGGYHGSLYRIRTGQWLSAGVVRAHNAPSLRQAQRDSPGRMRLVSGSFRVSRWFGGRWTKTPPWDEVRALMEYVPDGFTPPELRPDAPA